jgi:hypothetical protein
MGKNGRHLALDRLMTLMETWQPQFTAVEISATTSFIADDRIGLPSCARVTRSARLPRGHPTEP